MESTQQQGLRIKVKLPELILDPWLELAKGESDTAAAPKIRQLNLDLERLLLKGTEFTPFRLSLEEQGKVLTGDVSSNHFEGTIEIPGDIQQTPLRLNLKRLDITFDPDILPGPMMRFPLPRSIPPASPPWKRRLKKSPSTASPSARCS